MGNVGVHQILETQLRPDLKRGTVRLGNRLTHPQQWPAVFMPCPLNPVGKGIQIEFISVISGKYGVCTITYAGADRAAVFLKSTVNWHDAKS